MAENDERWVADQLRQHASNDIVVADRSGFPGQGERDVIVLDASRGVLVVFEVKEWGEPALRGTSKSEREWEVRGLGPKKHPLLQAKDGLFALLDSLPSHCKPKRHGGSAATDFSWLYGVVFPNLSRAQAEELGLFDDPRLLPPGFPYLWRESFDGSATAAFRKAVDSALRTREWIPRPMGLRFRDKLWARISPNANASPKAEHRRLEALAELAGLDPELCSRLRATQHGPHRLNGVVGSGKTLFIAHKALEKALELGSNRTSAKNTPFDGGHGILVLCQTNSGASKLRNDIAEVARLVYADLGREEYIEIRYWHDFLRAHYALREAINPRLGYGPFLARQSPCRSYEVILLDEFQDFNVGWGAFLARHLRDTVNGLLLLTFDPAQGHQLLDLSRRFDEVLEVLRPERQNRSWENRNYKLKKSFRVPARIGQLAMRVHAELTRQQFEDPGEGSAEELAKVIHRAMRPQFVAPGGTILLRQVNPSSSEDEALAVADCMETIANTTDATPGDIAIVVPPKGEYGDEGQAIAEVLDDLGLDPFTLVDAQRDRFYYRGDRPVVATPMRLKGLEIPVVVIAPSLLRYLEAERTRKDAFYQAATRATSMLAILGQGRLFQEIECFYQDLERRNVKDRSSS